jgi:SOS-response transcriptional repressor LexA
MKQVDKRAFGHRVAQRREALRLSQGALAQAVGMKQQGIDHIEHGAVARPRLLRELASALQTTERWLLWQEGPEVTGGRVEVAQIPLISWVSAGDLADADTQVPIDDVPLLAVADLGRGEFFALRVEGDSMDRLSPPGSIIIVNRADRELMPERSYVFNVRGESMYKRWASDPPRLEPYSTNPVHKAIYIKKKKDLSVLGRVYRTVLDL